MEVPVGCSGPRTAGGDAVDHDDARSERPGGSGGPGDLRVGDTERSAALDALGEHLAAGRLDVDEFGDRSGRAAVAVRRADLEVLFTDLPAPHPPLPTAPGAAPQTRPVSPAPVPRRHPASAAPVVAIALVMLLALALPGLLLGAATTGSAGLFIFPLVFIALGHARRGRWHGRGPRDRW
jgi:hypothetical protein